MSLRLPDPAPAFRWIHDPSGLVLRCIPLEAIAQHAFTARQPRLPFDSSRDERGRLAHGRPFDSSPHRSARLAHPSTSLGMTLSLPKGQGKPTDSREPLEPWAVAAQSIGAPSDRVMRVRQVHGNAVRTLLRGRVEATEAEHRPDGDAIVSNEPGLALSVSVADCVPILIADPESGAAAAVHAGWRGTCARVVSAAIDVMRNDCGTDPANCTAAIGPSIGPDDYQVRSELVDAFLAAGHPRADIDRWFRRTGPLLTLDLWSASRDQLSAAGVPAANVFSCGLSTLTYPDVFESFRADHERAGRMAGLIIVPPPA